MIEFAEYNLRLLCVEGFTIAVHILSLGELQLR